MRDPRPHRRNGPAVAHTWAGGGSTYHPAYLKLTRDGATCTEYASKDDETWSQVGTAQVPSATGTGDARMVAGAAKANYPGENIEAVFSGFSVTS
ncbi:hypothetical protein ACFRQM_33425 [Streptomyces sp. NPDC056831]|uniref:hypothetical protein n=1 Tax=Streptomyces sp. NPDC056831 TaxID=3345954 RepID=UPI0036CC3428